MTPTFKEIWLQVNIEDITTEALDGVVERQNMHSLSVFDVEAWVNVDEITELDSQIVTGDLVHLDSPFFNII